MEWVRGRTIGRGSFGTVSLAISKSNLSQFETPVVVKSSPVSNSSSLKKEAQILSQLNHPHVVRFLGHSFSFEKDTQFYNLFLEYAHKGSLADHLRISGGSFVASDVKKYTNSILRALCYIHQLGFLHGDVKLQNVLLFDDGFAKMADFGLAKCVSDKTDSQFRGTPLYMSPEIVSGGEVGSSADIWALGCAVVEMVTGRPAWSFTPESDVSALLYRIGVAGESPQIPASLCDEGKDFLRKCFAKDPNERWTARMLLDHPFVFGFQDLGCSNNEDKPAEVSPKCTLEFPDWESTDHSTLNSSGSVQFSDEPAFLFRSLISTRFGSEMVSDEAPQWSDVDAWVTVT